MCGHVPLAYKYHYLLNKVNFNAAKFSSGIYFYRIVAEGNNGQRFVSIKKLVLLK
jgi:hypothetical protein